MKPHAVFTAGIVFLCCIVARAEAPKNAPPIDRFESRIEAYERMDKQSPPKPGGTVFIGSSTFAMWQGLEEDMKAFDAINRGFGGSTIPEVLHYMDRVVLPYKPSRIVFYTGENDLAIGYTPQQAFEGFKTFVERAKQALPGVQIYYLTIKTSPQRERLGPQFDEFHRLVSDYAAKDQSVHFIDTRPLMMDEQGKPRAELYLDDRLHMNRKGYELWIPVITKALRDTEEK